MSDLRLPRDRQHRLLIDIYQLAYEAASWTAPPGEVDDVASEVTLDCQAKLRSGTMTSRPRHLRAFVRTLVEHKIVDRYYKQLLDAEYDAQHLRDRTMTLPAWMTPDCAWTEESIVEFRDDMIKKLPRRCRMAYYMVRVEGSTYKEAAERVGVSVDTVRNYIVEAHALFRAELRLLGVAVPSAAADEKAGHTNRRSTDDRFAPAYVTQRPAMTVESTSDTNHRPAHTVDRSNNDAAYSNDAARFPNRDANVPGRNPILEDADSGPTDCDAEPVVGNAGMPNTDRQPQDAVA